MKKITASQLLVFSALGWMLIGILSLSSYQNTYLPAIKYAGMIILLDGLLLTAVSFRCNGTTKEKRWIRAEAIVNLFFSFLLVLDPVFTDLIFVFLVTPWVVTKGFVTMIASLSLRKSVHGWRGDFLGGSLLAACGLLISHNPTDNPFGINILIGAIGCTIGLLYFYDAYRFRQINNQRVDHRHLAS
ncbi:HdeD family acid-resistance protein [Puia dinghuensis]|nr:DUF308 domain-containing protein [Puia dinghuensis]